MFGKEKVLLHFADWGRWVSQCDCWQLMHSPESSQGTVFGTGYFQQDLMFYCLCWVPLHICKRWGGEGGYTSKDNRDKNKGTFQLMRSVRIACQGSVQPAQVFGSHVLEWYFTCGETWGTDPDLYGFVPAGLFFQLITIFVMLIFVFIFDVFFLLQRNEFCQIIHRKATKSDRVALPNGKWLVQPNRTVL